MHKLSIFTYIVASYDLTNLGTRVGANARFERIKHDSCQVLGHVSGWGL